MAIDRIVEQLEVLRRDGGWIVACLLATAFVLWFTLGDRLMSLRRGDRRTLRALVAGHLEREQRGRGIVGEAARRGAGLWRSFGGPVPRTALDESFADLEAELRRGARLVACLIAMSPLLGLLGTVTGLIETFSSLGHSSTSAASEGIAGGIVQALYATQMGLAIAVPGLLTGGVLHHREQKLALELEQLKALLAGAADFA